MRHALTIVAAAIFAAACSGGSSSTSAGPTTTGTTTGSGSTTGGAKLAAGIRCTSNDACASGICGVSGTGNCCAQACNTGNPTCAATDCDSTGACSYPDSTISCPASCDGGQLSQNVCDGNGGCRPTSTAACPSNFGCNTQGTACTVSCTQSSQCAPGFVCNANACVTVMATGTCTEDDDCTSNLCGTHGHGHCCSQACPYPDAGVCAPSDCNPDGSCQYPGPSTPCGSVLQSCTGNTLTNPTHCDGQGNCDNPGTSDCTPYICGATACDTSCSADAGGCVAGAFCDILQSTCCEGLGNGGTLAVDAVAGSDLNACCGLPGKTPCQTLHHAMSLIDAAQATGVTLKVTPSDAGDWTAAGEVYPVVLGWGVVLNAPGVYFRDPNDGANIFTVGAVSSNDKVGYASIVGSAASPVTIGIDSKGVLGHDVSVLQVNASSTLYVANATLNSNFGFQTVAVSVRAGGALVLGQDQAGDITGTVTIGNQADNFNTLGYDGIVCGTAKLLGCTITDATLPAGTSSVVIQGQANMDLDAEDYANITLTSAPVVGVPPAAAGFKQCGAKAESQDNFQGGGAILLRGKATMTFKNGTVQCTHGDAFDLAATANGSPQLTLDNTTIQNTQAAVHAQAGTATISNSTIQFNYQGVIQDTDGTNVGTIDLSGGTAGGTNTVVCSSRQENAQFNGNLPGASVINTTPAPLDADNVAWDTSAPDVFECNGQLASCTCKASSCTLAAGSDGMDAVYESTTGTISTNGNTLSTISCGG